MSPRSKVQVIILAAGKGTRMHSPLPKVLHTAGGLPLIGHVLNTVEQFDPQDTFVVLSPQIPEVEEYVRSHAYTSRIIHQAEQLGTAHAALCAFSQIDAQEGPVLILFGDTPLIQVETLHKIVESFQASCPKVAALIVGMCPSNPKNYGRILLEGPNHIQAIVEAKEATPEILALTLCNSGVMVLERSLAKELLQRITANNLSSEYYLTDIVKVARNQGHRIGLYRHEDADELEGINSCLELSETEQRLQKRWRKKAMNQGVVLVDPESVYLSYDTQLAPGVKIYPHVVIGPGVRVESGVEIMPFTHLEGTILKSNAKVGPYARLRPGTVIEENARIGNFVEIKNTSFGARSKANHLSYIGDAQVGADTNIGAGTITCNYDGQRKWSIKIGRNVLVGANSSLVAPVVIGDEAVIGAGSTITKDVPSQALAIGRASQRIIDQGGQAYGVRIRAHLVSGKKEGH